VILLGPAVGLSVLAFSKVLLGDQMKLSALVVPLSCVVFPKQILAVLLAETDG
jgi:hypothetical protein